MSRSTSILTWTAPLGLAIALSACEGPAPSTGDAKADAAVLEACRQRANEAYDRRNRADIYAPNYSGNSPLSGSYTDVGLNRDLSARFSYEQMVRDCVRTANVTTERGAMPSPGTNPAPASATGSTPAQARAGGASARPPSGAPLARAPSGTPVGAPAGSGGAASPPSSAPTALPGAGSALPPPGLTSPR